MLWTLNAQIIADLGAKKTINFAMARHGAVAVGNRIEKYAVVAAFPQQKTAARKKMF